MRRNEKNRHSSISYRGNACPSVHIWSPDNYNIGNILVTDINKGYIQMKTGTFSGEKVEFLHKIESSILSIEKREVTSLFR